MVFVATGKTPGVYVDEVQLPGPIVGVGTSTAAFLGPARRGPASTPTYLTSWTEFLNTFGVTSAIDPSDPYGPYLVNPDAYVTHAVNGFFANGGTACYFVRVTDAEAATATVPDQASNAAFTINAIDPGVDGNSIQYRVTSTPAVTTQVAWPAGISIAFTAWGNSSAKVAATAVSNFNKKDVVQLVDSSSNFIAFATISSLAAGTINFTFAAPLTQAQQTQFAGGGSIQKGNIFISVSGNTAQVNPGDEQDFLPGTGVNLSLIDSKGATQTATGTVLSTSTGTITFTNPITFTNTNNLQPPPNGPGTITAVSLNGDVKEAPFSAAGSNTVTLTNASDTPKVTQNEIVTVYDQNNSEQATVNNVSGTTITFNNPLQNAYPNGGIISNSTPATPTNNQSSFFIAGISNLTTSLPLTISQQVSSTETLSESVVVLMVDRRNQILYLANPLVHQYNLQDTHHPITITSQDFNLIVTNGAGSESYGNLSMDPGQPNYYLAKVVNSNFITLQPPQTLNTDPPPSNVPAAMPAFAYLKGGVAETPFTNWPAPYYNNAIDTLIKYDDINLVCVPDRYDPAVQIKIIEHCDTDTQDRFALLDPPPNATLSAIQSAREGLSSDRGFGALFYPRIQITHPITGLNFTVPPSGHLAGLIANVDNTEGVFKAPGNEVIQGAVGLEQMLQPSDMGTLNDAGINVIRYFKGRGVVLWGARTIAPINLTQWRYISTRRLALYVEKSLQSGLQQFVFKPNNPSLWQQVSREVNAFLMTVFNMGAFAGATPAASFSVQVDAELNPAQLMAQGILNLQVILYPASPAEFIVIQMVVDPTGVALTES